MQVHQALNFTMSPNKELQHEGQHTQQHDSRKCMVKRQKVLAHSKCATDT
jgi:hypothetical protein